MNEAATTLAQKVVALHRSLARAELTHAFGGALALAYCTKDPRGTRDIDVNVFVSPDQVSALMAGLPSDVVVTEKNKRQLVRDGQSRLWWGETPVDVFLSNHSFHAQVEASRRFVSFAEIEELPVLACADLAVFKAFFGRAKDSIDTAAMVAAETIDLVQLERDTATLLGDDDLRAEFFALVRSAVPDFLITEHDLPKFGQQP